MALLVYLSVSVCSTFLLVQFQTATICGPSNVHFQINLHWGQNKHKFPLLQSLSTRPVNKITIIPWSATSSMSTLSSFAMNPITEKMTKPANILVALLVQVTIKVSLQKLRKRNLPVYSNTQSRHDYLVSRLMHFFIKEVPSQFYGPPSPFWEFQLTDAHLNLAHLEKGPAQRLYGLGPSRFLIKKRTVAN